MKIKILPTGIWCFDIDGRIEVKTKEELTEADWRKYKKLARKKKPTIL